MHRSVLSIKKRTQAHLINGALTTAGAGAGVTATILSTVALRNLASGKANKVYRAIGSAIIGLAKKFPKVIKDSVKEHFSVNSMKEFQKLIGGGSRLIGKSALLSALSVVGSLLTTGILAKGVYNAGKINQAHQDGTTLLNMSMDEFGKV